MGFHLPRDNLWLDALICASTLIHANAVPNMRRAALARAHLAFIDSDGEQVSNATLAQLCAVSGADESQIKKGTQTLIDAGLLEVKAPRGNNTPPVYRLAVPREIEWRRDWTPAAAHTPAIELTTEQQHLSDLLHEFLLFGHQPDGTESPAGVFLLHGYAGTGKTTATVQIITGIYGEERQAERVLYVATSNQAASVLREMGVNATTVASAFKKITGEDPNTGDPLFIHNLNNKARNYDLIVVDEASMVGREDALWIEQEANRLVVIGDPAQLAPIGDEPYWTAPGRTPDFELTQVVRANNPDIREVAYRIRTEGIALADVHAPLRVPHGQTVHLSDYDVVLCHTNDVRDLINRADRGTGPPAPGDRIMVLENTQGATDYSRCDDFYNGMILTIEEVLYTDTEPARGKRPAFTYHYLAVKDQDGNPRLIHVLDEYLLRHPQSRGSEAAEVEPRAKLSSGRVPVYRATYAKGATTHKFQGSGARRVLVIDPHMRTTAAEAARWAYTAVSRGIDTVHIARLDQVHGISGKPPRESPP